MSATPRDFDGLFATTSPWLLGEGPHAEMVLSSRIRLARNLREVPEFVVNLVSFALAGQMNATAAELPHGESEFAAFGIAAAPSAGAGAEMALRGPAPQRPPTNPRTPTQMKRCSESINKADCSPASPGR